MLCVWQEDYDRARHYATVALNKFKQVGRLFHLGVGGGDINAMKNIILQGTCFSQLTV